MYRIYLELVFMINFPNFVDFLIECLLDSSLVTWAALAKKNTPATSPPSVTQSISRPVAAKPQVSVIILIHSLSAALSWQG